MNKLDRRSFVTSLGASVGSVALLGMEAPSANATETSAVPVAHLKGRRPNVILMICDDLGFGDLSCFGSHLRTPHLDRMAAEGMRLRHYNGGHPICSASRGSLMTGRYAPRIGVRPVYRPTDTDGLPASEVTIANLLGQAKYKTMCIGKWHLGDKSGFLPTEHGFDFYIGVPYSVDMQPLSMYRDDSAIEEHTDPALLTPRYTQAALDFIQAAGKEPFFLYLAYNYPHIPIDASPRFKGKSPHGIYADAVEEIDWSVGQIMQTLRDKGIDEHTLVIFTGDHGPWYQGSTGLTRGRKGTTYEGGFRVPFIARWKGVLPEGRDSEAWATHLDILPTLTALCGAPSSPHPLDGADITNILAGGPEPGRDKATLYFSGLRNGLDLQCARKNGWKLRFAQYTREVYVLGGGDPGESLLLKTPELYDLNTDPEESYDVADRHPDIVRDLFKDTDAIMATFPPAPAESYTKLKQNVEFHEGPAGAAARTPKNKPGNRLEDDRNPSAPAAP